jgi:DNA-binding transcriptional MerR regulator
MEERPSPASAPVVGLRIGELGRRTGLRPEVLRAWERRYGLLEPQRTGGGQRLYTAHDERRIRRMQGYVSDGFSPAVAARMALGEVAADAAAEAAGSVAARGEPTAPAGPADAPTLPPVALDVLARALREALDSFDDAAANAAVDRLFATYSLDTVLRDVLLPFFAELGDRWERGEATIAQEHFASALVSGRLRGLARGWDLGSGPRALVGCPPGEAHELGLLCFSLALRARGWRVSYLGADVPVGALQDTCRRLDPAVVVLAAVHEEPFQAAAGTLRSIATERRLSVGGRGATAEVARRLGAERLSSDPILAADRLSAG